jgi:hypothetical protein
MKRISCKKQYKETSRLINGYDQLDSIPRALGFENSFKMGQNLHGYRHLINTSDIEYVVLWLFENGYDITMQKDDPKKIEVFSRKECIFHYCPNPDSCKDKCINPEA